MSEKGFDFGNFIRKASEKAQKATEKAVIKLGEAGEKFDIKEKKFFDKLVDEVAKARDKPVPIRKKKPSVEKVSSKTRPATPRSTKKVTFNEEKIVDRASEKPRSTKVTLNEAKIPTLAKENIPTKSNDPTSYPPAGPTAPKKEEDNYVRLTVTQVPDKTNKIIEVTKPQTPSKKPPVIPIEEKKYFPLPSDVSEKQVETTKPKTPSKKYFPLPSDVTEKQVEPTKPKTPRKKDVDLLTLKNLDKILTDATKGLDEFKGYIDNIPESNKKLLNESQVRKIYSVTGDNNEELILKEMVESGEVKQNIDRSPLITKYVASESKRKYPERLLKYYGDSSFTKSLSKRLSGDLSKCSGRSIESKECVINGKELDTYEVRIQFLTKNYKELIQALNELHDLGLAHADIKWDNVFVDQDRIYIADYDKSCRTRDLNTKNKKISSEINKITKCSDIKELPLSHIPYDQYITPGGYKDRYDFYELAITLYEIIMAQPYLTKVEIDATQDKQKLYEDKYFILKSYMDTLMSQVKTKEEKELLNFIIQNAKPYTLPCDRNTEDPNVNLECYETKNKKTGDDSIIPSYCDRILYNYDPNGLYIDKIIPKSYGSFSIDDPKYKSDHNAVYAQMMIQFKDVQVQNIIERLSLTYVTLNQGEGVGDDKNANLEPLLDKCRGQDIIVIGLQEIQSRTISDKLSQKESPLVNRLSSQLGQSYSLIHSDIYGLPTRRVGLFVIVKTTISSKLSDPMEKCLVTGIGITCNKSMVGATLEININAPNPPSQIPIKIYLNLYSAHLTFSRKYKDLGLSKRIEQLGTVIKTIGERSMRQVNNYINILGGDLNFRNSDSDSPPEKIVTNIINEIITKAKGKKDKWSSAIQQFMEPLLGSTFVYSFPPSCKYRYKILYRY